MLIDYCIMLFECYIVNVIGGVGFDIVYDIVGGVMLDLFFQVVWCYMGYVFSSFGWGVYLLVFLFFCGVMYFGVFMLLLLLIGEGLVYYGEILVEVVCFVDWGLLWFFMDFWCFGFGEIEQVYLLLGSGVVVGKFVVDVVFV